MPLTRRATAATAYQGLEKMKNQIKATVLFPSQVALLALASAIAIPAMAQQMQQPDNSQSAPAAAQQTPTSTPPATTMQPIPDAKEGLGSRQSDGPQEVGEENGSIRSMIASPSSTR